VSALTYRGAVGLALAEELERDERVLLIGEDVGAAGGVFKATEGLFERFGPRRVRDTPISEQAIVGCALGAAVCGLRPVAEVMFADFAGVCYDQIANQLAKYRYMSGGQVTVPVTIRMANGAGAGFASQHSQTVENWFLNVPGLKIVVPGSPADAYSLLRAAVRDENPVLYFEHKAMLNVKGELDKNAEPPRIGECAVVRPGDHVTVVASQLMRARCEEAATELSSRGVEVELIDPRTIAPLDTETIGRSLDKTNRLLVVQESPAPGSWGATLVARMMLEQFDSFDAPPALLAGDETPIPYAGPLEEAWMPSVERIVTAAQSLVDS
jgi:pyruvate dehydrogenase E1 component beta subunit